MMKKLLLSVCLIVSTAAYAQPVAPTEYNISKLSSAEIDLLGRALGKLPYEEVAALIQKIRMQIVEQQQPKVSEPK